MAQQPLVGCCTIEAIIEASRWHTVKRTTLGRTPLDEWSARRRDLYLKKTQETDINVPFGIRTRSPTKRAATDPRLRQRGHRGRP
jgi:hypothetical protein